MKVGRELRRSAGVEGKRSEEAGARLRRVRMELKLTYRDVYEASVQIARRHGNDEFVLQLSRLSDIENKGVVPTIYRLYSLCAIYHLDILEVLRWYGVDASELPVDGMSIPVPETHLVEFRPTPFGDVQVPLALDPGLDIRKTTFLSRYIQQWGRIPLMLLEKLDLENHRYGLIGTEDYFMYPLLMPGALVVLDEKQRKIQNEGWTNEFDRPIYFIEHREGYACGWCIETKEELILQPHPSSQCTPRFFKRDDVYVIGQVVGVAMRLDQGRRGRTRS